MINYVIKIYGKNNCEGEMTNSYSLNLVMCPGSWLLPGIYGNICQ